MILINLFKKLAIIFFMFQIVSLSANTFPIELKNLIPSKSETQKYIYEIEENNGWVCSNYYRERKIKDKLFELTEKSKSCLKLEKRVIKKENFSFFKKLKTKIVYFSLGMLSGLVSALIINR